nr:RHS repeat-associated core domain-containing protein [Nitrogeniibacter mangrovi]
MVTALTYQPDSNRLAQIGTQSQSLDAAGNLVSEAGKSFAYGADGRMRSTTSGAGTVTYRYDGQGRRVEKAGPAGLVPNGAERFMYDEANHLIGEYQADGTPTREYVWLGDLPVAVIDTNTDGTTTAYAIETDHLGTPRLLTDATQSPSWRWTSPPFGEVLPDENPAGLYPVVFNLRFPGQYYDKESGLSYNWHRVYDAETGRYVQSDPIGLDGGWNTYGYVGGNPVSFIDPLGLASSGQTTQIPGGSPTTVRIDPPHVPGQQTHAHVCEKGCKEIVVNKDGTGSHNTDPSKLKNRVKNFLRARGFKLMWCPPLLEDLVMGMAAQQCSEGDLGACQIFQQMGGTILSDSLGGDI